MTFNCEGRQGPTGIYSGWLAGSCCPVDYTAVPV